MSATSMPDAVPPFSFYQKGWEIQRAEVPCLRHTGRNGESGCFITLTLCYSKNDSSLKPKEILKHKVFSWYILESAGRTVGVSKLTRLYGDKVKHWKVGFLTTFSRLQPQLASGLSCYSKGEGVLSWCCALMVVSSPNSYVEILTFQYLTMWLHLEIGSLNKRLS